MKLPFDVEVLDQGPVQVQNPYSGETCTLTPEAVAVYDVIKGAEMLGDYKTVQAGLDWFSRNYPEEYFVLLD